MLHCALPKPPNTIREAAYRRRARIAAHHIRSLARRTPPFAAGVGRTKRPGTSAPLCPRSIVRVRVAQSPPRTALSAASASASASPHQNTPHALPPSLTAVLRRVYSTGAAPTHSAVSALHRPSLTAAACVCSSQAEVPRDTALPLRCRRLDCCAVLSLASPPSRQCALEARRLLPLALPPARPLRRPKGQTHPPHSMHHIASRAADLRTIMPRHGSNPKDLTINLTAVDDRRVPRDRPISSPIALEGVDLSSIDGGVGLTSLPPLPASPPASSPTSRKPSASKSILDTLKTRSREVSRERSRDQAPQSLADRDRQARRMQEQEGRLPESSSMSKIYHLRKAPGSTPELSLVGSAESVAKSQNESMYTVSFMCQKQLR